MFLSLFNSFALAKDPPSIVCLQDPPVWTNHLPLYLGFTSFAPILANRRPQVAFYVFKALIDMATIIPMLTSRTDLATLDISAQ